MDASVLFREMTDRCLEQQLLRRPPVAWLEGNDPQLEAGATAQEQAWTLLKRYLRRLDGPHVHYEVC